MGLVERDTLFRFSFFVQDRWRACTFTDTFLHRHARLLYLYRIIVFITCLYTFVVCWLDSAPVSVDCFFLL